VVLLAAAALLILVLWFGHRGVFQEHFAPHLDQSDPYFGIYPELWWAGMWFFLMLLVPATGIKLAGGRLGDYGLRLQGVRRHLKLYFLLYLAVLPPVLVASQFESFRQTYPLCPEAGKSLVHLLIFEVAYALQFVALEFFFRGFLLFGLVRYLGALVIPLMAIPYAVIHMGKPFSEAMGAIVAGTVLGLVSLRTGSVVGGIGIHYAVALTMDLLALGQKSTLFQ
jgi:membrane protease YdiL (CAAX protease family)